MNAGASWPTPEAAEARVLEIQTKLHRWSVDEPQRRFSDLDNLVSDPAFLVVAWRRVTGNRGARTAGVDGQTIHYIRAKHGEDAFLAGLRDDLKARTFRPMPVRERMIPKPGGKQRRLGIPTVRDRVVQAALKLVFEPIFEADFKPCSYGFRPGRRTHDAIAEIHNFATNRYEWVVEGDITACFDEISHSGLMDRVRKRIGDKRVLGLVKAFLKSGILHEDGRAGDTITGTPQGGILSPVLANIALSALDEHFMEQWVDDFRARELQRRRGHATYRIVRYADDCVRRTPKEDSRSRWNRRRRCCTGDGGGPPGGALQGEPSNHRKVLQLRAGVLNVAEKAHRMCQVGARKVSVSDTTEHVSKAYRRRQNRGESLSRDESGGNLPTAQAAPGIKVARAWLRRLCGTSEPARRYCGRPGHGPDRKREGDPQAAGTVRGRVPRRRAGTDCPVVAMRPSNAGGAKGAGHPGLLVGQLRGGRSR